VRKTDEPFLVVVKYLASDMVPCLLTTALFVDELTFRFGRCFGAEGPEEKKFLFLHMFLHYVQQVIWNLRGLCCLLSFVRGHRFASLFLLLLVLPFVGNLLYGCDVKMRVAAASSLFAGARFCKAVAVSAP